MRTIWKCFERPFSVEQTAEQSLQVKEFVTIFDFSSFSFVFSIISLIFTKSIGASRISLFFEKLSNSITRGK